MMMMDGWMLYYEESTLSADQSRSLITTMIIIAFLVYLGAYNYYRPRKIKHEETVSLEVARRPQSQCQQKPQWHKPGLETAIPCAYATSVDDSASPWLASPSAR